MGVALAAAFVTAPASAATLSLGLDTAADPEGITARGITRAGTVLAGIRRGHFLQRFVVRLVADDGTPVTGCLGAGARIELIVKGTNDVRATSAACATDGLFDLRPVGDKSIQTPQLMTARIATTTWAGHRIGAARANVIDVRIAPNVVNESPRQFTGDDRYPIRVRVDAPPPGRVGRVVVMRRTASGWRVLSRHTPNAAGRIRTTVAFPGRVNSYAFVFVPAPGTGYISASTTMRITRDAATTSTMSLARTAGGG